jgi:hypothetical protein
MISNYKKFYLLHDRLMTLLDEQGELFYAQNPQFTDWLRTLQLNQKYPNLEEKVELNNIYTRQVINELKLLFGNPLTDEQMSMEFN